MRLIDADTIFNNELLLVSDKAYDAVHAVIERINNAPTVDAVEVVRCKDCKWYRNANDKYFPRTCDHWSEMFFYYEGWESVDENGFCSWGERREDGQVEHE